MACTILMTACASAHSNEIVAEGEVPVRLADSYSFTEGPATDARGNVYFIPEDWTANVCFGGKERNILFITASKSVYTLKMLVHGVTKT